MRKTIVFTLAIIIVVALVAAVYFYVSHTNHSTPFQGGDLVDDFGYSLTLTEPPERIVSLAPSNTEILFAVGAGDKVVGVTDFCNYPYDFAAWIEAGNMTSIGNYYGPSTEPIVALNPDLVLATTGSEDAAENLRNLGYNVLIIEPRNLTFVLRDILLVGRATNNYDQAAALESELRQRIDAISTQAEGATTTPKVYHEVWNEPLMSAGPGTFIDELITLAGGQNIFNDATASWPIVSSEAIIDKNPDVMIFPNMYMGVANFYETIDSVKNRTNCLVFWQICSSNEQFKQWLGIYSQLKNRSFRDFFVIDCFKNQI